MERNPLQQTILCTVAGNIPQEGLSYRNTSTSRLNFQLYQGEIFCYRGREYDWCNSNLLPMQLFQDKFSARQGVKVQLKLIIQLYQEKLPPRQGVKVLIRLKFFHVENNFSSK